MKTMQMCINTAVHPKSSLTKTFVICGALAEEDVSNRGGTCIKDASHAHKHA